MVCRSAFQPVQQTASHSSPLPAAAASFDSAAASAGPPVAESAFQPTPGEVSVFVMLGMLVMLLLAACGLSVVSLLVRLSNLLRIDGVVTSAGQMAVESTLKSFHWQPMGHSQRLGVMGFASMLTQISHLFLGICQSTVM